MNNNNYTEAALAKMNAVISEIKKAVVGKDDIITKVLLAIIAKGHILIEDIPGVGKTTMALAFSKVLALDYNRMQFTPDVLPTDVTGFTIYNKAAGQFEFKKGVAMCNLFLADEINRTSSKTQSALLEVMEEGSITVDGNTYELPKPYIVIATQNPIGSVGTHMLPESQLDRFMIKLSMGYPDLNSEMRILKTRMNNPIDDIKQIASTRDIIALQQIAENVYIDDKIYLYIARLADATRNHPMISLGLSPRGAISLVAISKAAALLNGRNYVTPQDIFFVFSDVAAHRIMLHSKARLSELTAEAVIEEILKSVPLPKLSEKVQS